MKKIEKILDILKKDGLVDDDKLAKIEKLISEGRLFEDVLLELKIVDDNKLAKIKSDLFNVPLISLLETAIDVDVLNLISRGVAENYRIICFEKSDESLKFAIVNPGNFQAISAADYIAKEEGLRSEFFVASRESFHFAYKQYKALSDELSSALEKREEEGEIKDSKVVDKGSSGIAKSAPVTKIVKVIISQAVSGGASDIHIEPLQNETRVRYRVDGILKTSLVLPKSVHSAIVARIKVMAGLKLDETRIPQDGRIRITIEKKDIDFRVSILPLLKVEKVVMRILNTNKGAPKLKELGFQGIQYEVLQQNITKTEGLLLVTGPTGSGKSTTLFSILEVLNKEGVNISTLEDPVEYQIKGVNQSQIRPAIGYSFAAGLRSFLRQDPDIIMVGEIRDEETAELAIHASLTGHSVLSTLHTTSAIGAIDRFIDMNIEPFLVGSTLHTVVAQRLARKICLHCKEEEKLSGKILDDVNAIMKEVGAEYIKENFPDIDLDNPKFYKGRGCTRCGETGYVGRISIVEVLDVNKKIKKIINDVNKKLMLDDVHDSQKYITMKQDGVIKVFQGLITVDEVLRVMKD